MEQDLATSSENISVQKYLKQESERLDTQIKIKDWALFVIE